MGKYFGYLFLFVGGFGALYEVVGVLQASNTNVLLNNLLGIVIGVIMASLGWKWIQDTKTTENVSERVADNVTNVFRKYAAPAGPKPQYDEYMEKITILNILKENSKTTREDIKNITNFDESEIDQVIKDLVEEERIVDFGNKFQIR